jgi:transposase
VDTALSERGSGVGVPSNLPIDGHSFRRVEVLTGTPRRRRWSTAEEAAIVSESLAPGAVTSEIALRSGVHRNQLYGWRRELAPRRRPMPGLSGLILFRLSQRTGNRVGSGAAMIEIEIAGVHCDVGGGYAASASGLSDITLGWMMGKAAARGLAFELTVLSRFCPPQAKHALDVAHESWTPPGPTRGLTVRSQPFYVCDIPPQPSR